MFLGREDVSADIRLPEASLYASDVSAMPAVRAFLLDMQRSLARQYDVIMDGRDIGTVVLPDAPLKVFLTASLEARARRRFLELTRKGVSARLEGSGATWSTGTGTTAAGLPRRSGRRRMPSR